MAYSTITKPADYFNTVLYTGDGTTSNAITGVGFSPEFCWLKSRSVTGYHGLFDIVRGTNNWLFSNATDAELTTSNGLSSFDADGFTIGDNSNINTNSATNVAWNWLAGGTASSNTDGSITSSVSANTTSGFSIVSYTGTGANATVGHGLGTAPKMVIVKNRSIVDNWTVGNTNIGWTKYLYLNSNAAEATDSLHWQNTAPTSSVFSVGTRNRVNGSGHNMIAFCFAEVKGFSKFGSFTGNGNADGTFVYTGFKPAFIVEKFSSGLGSWLTFDNKRNGINGDNRYLYLNGNDAELTTELLDITSNGFKHRHAGGANSAGTSIYMAFAENPLVANTGGGIPATAR